MDTQPTGPAETGAIPLLQQPPFRYVDAVGELDAVARRARLHLALEHGQHRYAEADALPGALLIEAMAQAGGVLLRRITVGEPGGFLVGIEQARLPPAVPFPAALDINVHLASAAPPFFTVHAWVCDGGSQAEVARASLQVMCNRSFP